MTETSYQYGDPCLSDRFWSHVKVVSSGCWEWTGARVGGYGQIWWDEPASETRWRGPAHRVSLFAFTGTSGPVTDHLCHIPSECDGGEECRHRRCVNPGHLLACTHKENSAVGRRCVGKPATPGAKTKFTTPVYGPVPPPGTHGTQTVEQVAALFGVEGSTVYRWRKEGQIYAAKVGHRFIFTDAEVARFERIRFAGLLNDEQDQVAS